MSKRCNIKKNLKLDFLFKDFLIIADVNSF